MLYNRASVTPSQTDRIYIFSSIGIKTQCDLNVCEHYNSRRMSGQKNVFYDALYRDQIPTQVSFVMARLDIGDG